MDTPPSPNNDTQKQILDFVLDVGRSGLGALGVIWAAIVASKKWRAREEDGKRKEAADLATVFVSGITTEQIRNNQNVDKLWAMLMESRVRETSYKDEIANLRVEVASLRAELRALQERIEG
jgi:hypothetical protein